MKLETRYAHHPEDVKGYDTETLRQDFLIERIFVPGEIALTYSHYDRMIVGGATRSRSARTVKIASSAPVPPRR